MIRLHWWIIGCATALLIFTLLPLQAMAQAIPGADQLFPTLMNGNCGASSTLFSAGGSSSFGSTSCGWFQRLSGDAQVIYVALFTIELVIVGAQGAMYKDNIGEFIAGFAFKVMTAALFLAIIANAGTIFPMIINTFSCVALNVTHSNTSCSGQDDYQGVMGNMLGYAAQYFLAADISRAADSAESAVSGIIVFGTGVPGLSGAFLMGHENFQIFCMALGMTCVMSAAGLLLTYLLLTFETQIILAIGVIFLAFQGSRFTAQFSQGYFSYCINIGTKFFVFYFMVAVLGQLLSVGNSSIGASIAGLAAGAAIPFGAGSIALVALTSPIPIICLITSVLVAAIPNFAGSLLQGTSALSANAAMGSGVVSSMAGAIPGGISQGMQAGKGGASDAMQRGGGKGPGGGGGGQTGGGVSAQTAPSGAKSAPTMGASGKPMIGAHRADAGAPSANGGGGWTSASPGGATGNQGTLLRSFDQSSQGGGGGGQSGGGQSGGGSSGNQATQMPQGSEGQQDARLPEALHQMSADDIGALSSQQANQALAKTDFKKMDDKQVLAAAQKIDYNRLDPGQRNDIMADEGKRKAATQGFKDSLGKNFAQGLAQPTKIDYAALANAEAAHMAKQEQPPSAVQVRISNPDHL